MVTEKKTKPQNMQPKGQPLYTCKDFRQEMILLGLQKQLHDPGLSKKKREILQKEITTLEELIGL
jgi:hypothetical protein